MGTAAAKSHISGLLRFLRGKFLYLLIALAALVGVTATTVYRAGSTITYIERQNEINVLLPRLQDLLVDLLSAETGQRGFLLTNRVSYLRPYQEALKEHTRKLAVLSRLASDDPGEQERLLWIDTLIKLKLEEIARTIALHEQGQHAAALEVILSDRGQSYMDDLRALLNEMALELVRERDAIALQLTEEARSTRELVVAGALLLLVFASIALTQLARSFRNNLELVKRLEVEATHCPLTGLYNRRYFDENLNHELAIAARNGRPLAVLFLDLDGFKAVNDQHGHETGDRLLQAVSVELKRTLRESDMLARLGGDEFAVLVIDGAGDRSRLAGLAERLIRSLDKLKPDPAWRGVGATVGIAVYPHDGKSASTLLAAADRAMYQAKARGKGRAHFAREEEGDGGKPPSRSAAAP